MAFDAEEYKQAITREWDGAAQGWHHWIQKIDSWLENATEIMLDQARVERGSRVIDIAAGDGGQSVSAAQRAGPAGEVLATDIAPEFVRLANNVASRLVLPQLRAEVMDAENLEVPDAHYDAAISRLGLMYLPHLQKGLSEIQRVLSPGGRVSAVIFTTAEKTPFFSIPIKIIRERRGLSPPDPGQPGPFSLGAPGVLVKNLAQAGFLDAQEQVIEAPLSFDSTEECVQWRQEASGTMQQMLRGLDETVKAEIWTDIIKALRQFETAEGFESPCQLLICSAVKP